MPSDGSPSKGIRTDIFVSAIMKPFSNTALFSSVKLGITSGFDLLFTFGGGEFHALNVSSILSREHKIVYFPSPQYYDVYRRSDQLSERIRNIERHGITLPSSFEEVLESDYEESKIARLYMEERVDFLLNFEQKGALLQNFHLKLMKLMKVPSVILIQGLADMDFHFRKYIADSLRLFLISGDFKVLLYRLYHYLEALVLLREIESLKNIRLVLVVNNSYERNVKIKHPNVRKLSPPNGILGDPSSKISDIFPWKERTGKVQNKILFFYRLFYHKGLFDIPMILKFLREKGDVKLVIAGKFVYARDRERFFNILAAGGVSDMVEYRGFLKESDLIEEIKTSRVVLYPSHSDSFSMVVAQSLLFGTPVVAYNIAGLSHYGELKAVKLVNEYDYRGAAESVREFLSMPSYDEIFDDPKLEKFFKTHTWENVASQYIEAFKSLKG